MNDWLPGCSEYYVDLPGLRMHYVSAGPDDGRPVILLHGFPEFWYSWRFQIPALAQAGYRAIAPDQRGYNLTSKNGPYDVDTLIADVAHLQDALGLARSHVVGHDWGGALAWSFAAVYPRRVDRLVVLNAPHLNAYQDTLRHYPRQLLKSWYFLLFQIPVLPEWLCRRDDYRLLRRLFAQVDSAHMTEEDIQRYVDACARPGALSAMLGWYRAAIPGMITRRSERAVLRVEVPTRVIWGEHDVALDRHCTDTLRRYVGNLDVRFISDASHWVQLDRPERVNELILDFLGK